MINSIIKDQVRYYSDMNLWYIYLGGGISSAVIGYIVYLTMSYKCPDDCGSIKDDNHTSCDCLPRARMYGAYALMFGLVCMAVIHNSYARKAHGRAVIEQDIYDIFTS